MSTFTHPPPGGNATDPPDPPEPRTRCTALRMTADEAARVRIAVRKVARALGGFKRLACMMEVPESTVYYAARPNSPASLAFAVRFAAAAKVPVEVLLSGKLAVQPPVIGVLAEGRAA